MADYIEREAVLALTKEIHVKAVGYKTRQIDPGDVMELPAADVAPVRYGRWSDPAEDMCVCTSCGWGFLLPYKTRAEDAELVHGFNYCPNCGAKMEGYDAQ